MGEASSEDPYQIPQRIPHWIPRIPPFPDPWIHLTDPRPNENNVLGVPCLLRCAGRRATGYAIARCCALASQPFARLTQNYSPLPDPSFTLPPPAPHPTPSLPSPRLPSIAAGTPAAYKVARLPVPAATPPQDPPPRGGECLPTGALLLTYSHPLPPLGSLNDS